jgi:hypothetical protein
VYNIIPKIGVVPCHTLNVDVVIEFGSIGVLKVAEIILIVALLANSETPFVLDVAAIFLTAATLADTATPLVLDVVGIVLIAAAIAGSLTWFIVLRGSFVAPLAGDVRITVGATGQYTGPVISSSQPLMKTTMSNMAVSPAESMTPGSLRNIGEKCVHRRKTVVGFVIGVFIDSSIK